MLNFKLRTTARALALAATLGASGAAIAKDVKHVARMLTANTVGTAALMV